MRSISLTEVRRRWPELIRSVSTRRTRFAITKYGRPQVVVLPIAEYERLRDAIGMGRRRV